MRIKLKILQQGFGLEGDIYVRKQFPLERRNRHYPDLKPPKHGGGRNINPKKEAFAAARLDVRIHISQGSGYYIDRQTRSSQ